MRISILFGLCALTFAQSEICGDNQHYNNCGTSCPNTCDIYKGPPQACILVCRIGCECDEGYVLNRDKECVLPQNCPKSEHRRSIPDRCELEKDTGPCKAAIKKYYFNKETGQCESFTYGGCEGNMNNFVSKEECERVCSKQ